MKLRTGKGRKVVIDTNIAVSALIAKEGAPAKLFEMLILGEIENYTSREIIKELKAVLNRDEITKRTPKKARQFILKHYISNSIHVRAKERINAVQHSSDNKFIEVALEAGAGVIITGDSHLLQLEEFRGIKIVRAKHFLEVKGQ
ncbi:MAG: putative toxin-antitoxin system toxin component, PIN family [Candidatus Diapherotrites archaeon]|uniref:Toxin-antitoxin system toxin component, PIN family n=1 Tax=Candidatus Iainarchaeum sp. TaxID=3101447 RepID=A0A938YPE0_9ARCH|nr:putative toxin-antitoxin system toxin component, PIN family [Candidatus Diapherotrites archaeon]